MTFFDISKLHYKSIKQFLTREEELVLQVLINSEHAMSTKEIRSNFLIQLKKLFFKENFSEFGYEEKKIKKFKEEFSKRVKETDFDFKTKTEKIKIIEDSLRAAKINPISFKKIETILENLFKFDILVKRKPYGKKIKCLWALNPVFAEKLLKP